MLAVGKELDMLINMVLYSHAWSIKVAVYIEFSFYPDWKSGQTQLYLVFIFPQLTSYKPDIPP